MSQKRKSIGLKFKLDKCDKCECYISTKDSESHLQECPPPDENWSHEFIRDSVLHSKIETRNLKEIPEKLSETEVERMVFLSVPAMTSCKIALEDKVLLTGKNVVVKTAWLCETSNPLSVSLTKTALELDDLGSHIKVKKFEETPYLAKEVTIKYLGKQPLPEIREQELSSELKVMIQLHTNHRVIAIGNKLCIPSYGRKLIFKIEKVKFNTDLGVEEEKVDDLSQTLATMNISGYQKRRWFKTIFDTKWVILQDKEEVNSRKKKFTCEDFVGYSDLIFEIRDNIENALGKYGIISEEDPIKGMLLYGPPGIGKSAIANAVIAEYGVNSETLDLIHKDSGDFENVLKDLLKDAVAKAPSIVLLENVDALCSKENSSNLSILNSFFDQLLETNANVAVLATTSKLDSVDDSLRRGGRLQEELEVEVPDRLMRRSILSKILSKLPHGLTEENIDDIASESHGFIAGDLRKLVSRAGKEGRKRLRDQNKSFSSNEQMTSEDFKLALKNVHPSAMRQNIVEVPNVKWSDIGGQEDLKLRLKQAVEWPLKHSESFKKAGIRPPRGVLMFGPPGCSKTMIAKALATESKLNFLNINGPELFSKYVGDSEKSVRKIFRKAKQVAPSIIFIDEIDALGGERTSSKSGGSNVQERVLTQLLTELDGVTELGHVTLVAATNRPDRIDEALLRPGRFDRIIYVPLPDAETRKEIFSIKLKGMPVDEDLFINNLVENTVGYSGADIQSVCQEAAMKALESDLLDPKITTEHFEMALSIVKPSASVSSIEMYDKYLAARTASR